MSKRAGVLGHPIAHSLSPRLHRVAYRHLGLNWYYDAYDVTAVQLPSFLAEVDDSWAGISLTMPLKQEVLGLLNNADGLVKTVGSCNTVLVQPGPSQVVLVGVNTDVMGLAQAIAQLVPHPRQAAIVGTGATARSALAALATLGCRSPRVHARAPRTAGSLVRTAAKMMLEVSLRPLTALPTSIRECDLVISTVPGHAHPDVIAIADGQVPGGALLDVVYDPDPTELVSWWRQGGGRAENGLAMLLYQAQEQIRLMTSHLVPLPVLSAALDNYST